MTIPCGNSALCRARTRNEVLIKFAHQFHELLVSWLPTVAGERCQAFKVPSARVGGAEQDEKLRSPGAWIREAMRSALRDQHEGAGRRRHPALVSEELHLPLGHIEHFSQSLVQVGTRAFGARAIAYSKSPKWPWVSLPVTLKVQRALALMFTDRPSPGLGMMLMRS